MVAIANVEMAEMWDGEADEWIANADRYDATDRWINERFEAETVIGSRDRVLDVGCGTGKSSRDAARRARDGSVLGVDLSSRMLDDARRRSAEEGLTNVEFLHADAQVHPFEPGSIDVAISVFGAMFFDDPVAALANIRRSLRPGGRIAFLAWQRFEHNEWLTTLFDSLAAGRDLPAPPPGTPGPFGLADAEDVTTMLGEAGYVDPHEVDLRADVAGPLGPRSMVFRLGDGPRPWPHPRPRRRPPRSRDGRAPPADQRSRGGRRRAPRLRRLAHRRPPALTNRPDKRSTTAGTCRQRSGGSATCSTSGSRSRRRRSRSRLSRTTGTTPVRTSSQRSGT